MNLLFELKTHFLVGCTTSQRSISLSTSSIYSLHQQFNGIADYQCQSGDHDDDDDADEVVEDVDADDDDEDVVLEDDV